MPSKPRSSGKSRTSSILARLSSLPKLPHRRTVWLAKCGDTNRQPGNRRRVFLTGTFDNTEGRLRQRALQIAAAASQAARALGALATCRRITTNAPHAFIRPQRTRRGSVANSDSAQAKDGQELWLGRDVE
jgi:hypothetical protein